MLAMKSFAIAAVSLSVWLSGFCTSFLSAQGTGEALVSWTQWRGPDRDGSFQGQPLPDRLDDSSLKRLWSADLGPSYSGPIVTEDRVFVTETRDEKYEVVSALSRATGDVLWQAQWQGSMQVPFFARENGSWIRSTPVWNEGRLYVGGIRDVLVCLDADNGEMLWKKDFPAETGSRDPDFGFASSPLVHGDAIYVQAGGGLHKLNKEDGSVVWKSLDDGGGMFGSAFSSPVVATINGVEQLLVQTRTTLNGVNLQDGRVLWSQEVPNFRGMNILTPVAFDNSVFTSSYRNHSFLYDIASSGDQWSVATRWQVKKPAYMSTPVEKDGFVYMHLQNQRFTCLDLKNGETRWTSEPFGKYSSLIIQGDKVLALDQRGELLLFRATPEKFDLLSDYRVSDQETWAHLAASGDELFVRELNGITAFRFESGGR
jgi:outer membrane protein assembly factor BamB